jgi:hypothetical protein
MLKQSLQCDNIKKAMTLGSDEIRSPHERAERTGES